MECVVLIVFGACYLLCVSHLEAQPGQSSGRVGPEDGGYPHDPWPGK